MLLSSGLLSQLCDVRIVASLYGQEFEPITPALIAAPQHNKTLLPRCCANGTIRGNDTANKPHDEPVETAISANEINTASGSISLLT